MKREIDLTKGSVAKQLLLFCLPIYIGQLFQQLYNTVDSIVVGQFVSSDALAAVTASGTVTQFIVQFFLGVATGASVLFSLYYSRNERDMLSEAVHTTILFSSVLGLILTVIAMILSPWFLEILSCPESVFSEALVYLRVYLFGMLFTAMYNTASAVLRSIGDSQSPFYYLVIASVVNIVLDVVFVVNFHWGVAGVAIATVISQFISMMLSIRRLRRDDSPCRLEFRKLKINRSILKHVIALGLPAGVQSSIQSISNMVTQRYINSFGSAYMAGIGSAQKIDMFAGMSANSLGLGVTTFVSQNIGAKNWDRVQEGVRKSIWMCVIVIAATSIPIYIFAESLMHIFTQDEAVIAAGAAMLRTIMPFYEVMGLNGVVSGIVRGYGKSNTVMLCSLFGMVLCRQVWLAVGLHLNHDIQVILNGYPVGWIMMFIPMILYYFLKLRGTEPDIVRQ